MKNKSFYYNLCFLFLLIGIMIGLAISDYPDVIIYTQHNEITPTIIERTEFFI